MLFVYITSCNTRFWAELTKSRSHVCVHMLFCWW